MAQITIEINDNNIPRIKAAFISALRVGDAVDLENPTNIELIAKVEKHLKNCLRGIVINYEHQTLVDNFNFVELE